MIRVVKLARFALVFVAMGTSTCNQEPPERPLDDPEKRNVEVPLDPKGGQTSQAIDPAEARSRAELLFQKAFARNAGVRKVLEKAENDPTRRIEMDLKKEIFQEVRKQLRAGKADMEVFTDELLAGALESIEDTFIANYNLLKGGRLAVPVGE